MDGRDRAPPAQAGPRGGDDEVGEGVGQRGRGARPEDALTSEGPEAILAAALGCGADLFLVGAEPEDEQGLRAAARERRGVRLRGDEPPDGKAFGSLMRLSDGFLTEI